MCDFDESQAPEIPETDQPAGQKTIAFATRINGVDLDVEVTIRWGEEVQSSMDRSARSRRVRLCG